LTSVKGGVSAGVARLNLESLDDPKEMPIVEGAYKGFPGWWVSGIDPVQGSPYWTVQAK